jgi:endoglucanase
MKRLLCRLLLCLALPACAPSSTSVPTSDIKVDQVGYQMGMAKLAFLVNARAATDASFTLRRESDDSVVFQGRWTAPVFDPGSGDQVRTADFTLFDMPGTYYLSVPELGRSWRFEIRPDIYARAYYLTARGFYGQRCGSAVDLGPEFPGYRHEVCHTAGAYDASSGKAGARVSSNGWHDAGDYGRYTVSSGISTATLLWVVELWGKGGMRKVSLHIPESGNGTPDLLSEARWNIDWMLTMQDSDGGVWHKQTSAHFCGFVLPEKDHLPSLVIGAGKPPFKTTCATADFAAVTAIAARVFEPYDRAYADRCLAAAKMAWRWLESHEPVVFHNPPGITTGEYGDEHCSDEQLWAAAELARTTGDSAFESYFHEHYSEALDQLIPDNPPSFPNMGDFALWTYAVGNGKDKAAVKAIQDRSVEVANAIATRTEADAYHVSLVRKNYVWGSNGVAANYSLQLMIANRFRPDRRFVAAASDNVHYLLGRNTFSLSYVTQLGSNTVQHIHHRPSGASHLPHPWPGLLSGGPNPGRQDPVMKRAIPADCPPARAFIDDQGSYASNEIAINWNAPLVFALASILPDSGN